MTFFNCCHCIIVNGPFLWPYQTLELFLKTFNFPPCTSAIFNHVFYEGGTLYNVVRKMAERILEDKLSKLKLALDSSEVGFWMVERSGKP